MKDAVAAGPDVLITRVLNAPRELVFKAWIDPKHLVRWYAPNGCTIEYKEIDVRVGGRFISCIRNPSWGNCWVTGTYLEIARPSRLVLTMGLCDESGKRVASKQAGHDPEWPEETTVTVTLDERDGKTTLTLHQNVSEALAKRTGAHPSWLQMLDRLETELNSL
jgi:uncharacterized protein YndB with AHSA1/START domain